MVERMCQRPGANQPRSSSQLRPFTSIRAGNDIYNYPYAIASARALASRLPGVHDAMRCSSSGFQNPDVREAAKKLSAIFYDGADEGRRQPTSLPPAAEHLGRQHNTLTGDPREQPPSQGSSPPPPPPLHDLPLWRADSVVLVGQQALLHVHTPHYVHMFDRLFASRRRPWLFGHVRLPAGSRNLGAPEWALCAPGSRAPTIGVLMEVNRAVRLEDGKLMVLATALCRIQVRQCLSETPYSRARVDVLHEEELLESFHATGLRAALDAGAAAGVPPAAAAAAVDEESSRLLEQRQRLEQSQQYRQQQQQEHEQQQAPGGGVEALARDGGKPDSCAAEGPQDGGTVQRCARAAGLPHAATVEPDAALRLGATAAQAAASAATWRWLGYEAFAARATAWAGRCPAEGSDPADTRRLVSELVSHGVLSVVPFVDGPVAGRWDLAAWRAAAAADAAAAAVVAAAKEGFVGRGKGEDKSTADEGVCCMPAAAEDATEGAGERAVPGGASKGEGAGEPSEEAGTRSPGAGAEGNAAAGPGAGARADSITTISDRVEAVAAGTGALSASAGSSTCYSGLQTPEEGGGGGGDGKGDSHVPSGSGADAAAVEEGLTGHTTYDLLLLEARVWSELDALAVLQARAHQQRLGLPLGLLQLRPSDELAAQQLAAAAPPSFESRRQAMDALPSSTGKAGLGHGQVDPAAGFDAAQPMGLAGAAQDVLPKRSSGGASHDAMSGTSRPQAPQYGSVQPRVHPASEGLDVYCHPAYPLERRITRLSYATEGIFIESQDSASRQQVLEMSSVRLRLLDVLRRARKARSILAAMAAVKALRP